MLNKMRLLTPGPTPLPEEVRLALARDMIHHRKRNFQEIMARVQQKLRALFGTQTPVLPLSCSGTGAMTAAIYSLFKPGEKVLVVEAGKFGERWSEIAKSRGLVVERLTVTWGDAVRPDTIKSSLQRDSDIAGVLLQLSETSTGVLNPVGEIAAAMTDSGTMLIVDGISGVGISPCPMADWHIDCLVTGSQKGLMLPPGLALLALSERAWSKAEKTETGCFYFNLPKERACLEKGQTNFTSPVNLILGLDAALDLVFQKGLDRIYTKQWALTMLVRSGVAAMGLEPLAKENFAWGVTSVLMPEGIDGRKVLKICEDEYGIVMAGGQDQLKGKIIRIGHMGWVDWGDCIAALCALGQALSRYGFAPAEDYAGVALRAWNENAPR